MQKFDQRSLIYGTIGVLERVLVRQSKRAIKVRAIEVLLYIGTVKVCDVYTHNGTYSWQNNN